MSSMPVRSPAQRQQALVRAQEARAQRAAVKAALSSGHLTARQALERCSADVAIGGLPVRVFLRALPGVGERKADRIMSTIGIAESRRLRGLGQRQRSALLEWL